MEGVVLIHAMLNNKIFPESRLNVGSMVEAISPNEIGMIMLTSAKLCVPFFTLHSPIFFRIVGRHHFSELASICCFDGTVRWT
jgi:hypothetical protein